MKLCWDTATAVRPRAISGCFRLQQYLADQNGCKRDVGRTVPERIYCGALDGNDTARTTHRTKRTKVEDHSLGAPTLMGQAEEERPTEEAGKGKTNVWRRKGHSQCRMLPEPRKPETRPGVSDSEHRWLGPWLLPNRLRWPAASHTASRVPYCIPDAPFLHLHQKPGCRSLIPSCFRSWITRKSGDNIYPISSWHSVMINPRKPNNHGRHSAQVLLRVTKHVCLFAYNICIMLYPPVTQFCTKV